MAVPCSRTSVCSFVGGETGEVLPEPYKTPSSRLLMCMFLAILSETDYMSMGSGPSIIYCAHSSAPFRTEQRSVATCKTCKSIPVLGGDFISLASKAGELTNNGLCVSQREKHSFSFSYC